MMMQEIIIAGFGGQGVMALGKILAEAALEEGKNVSWLPSYGPEMRGGTANCNVIISDEEIGAPIVTEANTAIIFNRPSLEKFESNILPGGILLVNSSLIKIKATRTDIKVFYVPATEIAAELGNIKVANMVLLGAFLSLEDIIKKDTIIQTLTDIFTKERAYLVELNEKAINKGIEYIQKAVY